VIVMSSPVKNIVELAGASSSLDSSLMIF
jgi:hypothetical protein